MTNKHHLVFGASGAQGGEIAKALVAQGQKVRGVVSSPNSKVPEGVEKVVANLADSFAIDNSFHDITHATLTLPLVYDTATINLYLNNIVNSAKSANIQRLVLNSNIRTLKQPSNIAAFDTRLYAGEYLRESGIPMVILEPAVYLENLLSPTSINAIKNSNELYYPLPEEMSISWISHKDLGAAVCAAHKMQDIPTNNIAIGTDPMSGQTLADVIGASIGKNLNYKPLDPIIFEQTLAKFINPEAATGVAGIYHWAFKNPKSILLGYGNNKLNDQLDFKTTHPAEWARQFFAPLM